MQVQSIAHEAAEGAYRALYRAHALALTRLAYLLLGDRGLAGDIVQEAFGELRRRPARLADSSGAVFYLRTRVLAGCRTVLRGSSAARALALVDPADGPPAPGMICTSTASLGAAERRALLCAVRRLPARQREALVLRFYLGEPEAEVARLMGIRRGAVRSVTYRALVAVGRLAEEAP